MGIFSKIKNSVSSSANAALDKAIDPAKELDLAIADLDEGRKKALAELVTYKATAKQMDAEIARFTAKAEEWEQRAMRAVRAGDDDAAKQALREQKNCAIEIIKIRRDRDEATGYAVQLNTSRKQFETKLAMLKMRKNTLATQMAAARNGGDAFGNDPGVWDKFKEAEDRIDATAAEAEVEAAMRGEDLAGQEFDQKLLAAAGRDALGTGGAGLGGGTLGGGTDDALAAIKRKVEADRQARAQRLAAPAQPSLPAPDKPAPPDKPDEPT